MLKQSADKRRIEKNDKPFSTLQILFGVRLRILI